MPRRPRGPRRIAVLVYPGFQALDAVGPMEVFVGANRALQTDAYAPELVGTSSAPEPTSSGYAVAPARTYRSVRGELDTLIVAGGSGTREAVRDDALVAWIRRTAARARRVVSVCTGAFLLARAGLLDGRRATTHWASCAALTRSFPGVEVDADPIFVKDGNVYTSAGVTAGIDLALALVEEDHGSHVAMQVARQLVVFLKRPGGQSQFSVQMRGESSERRAFQSLQSHIAEHPGADLSVAAMAKRCAMSPRNFARRFAEELGESPGRYVRRARVEHARRRLEDGADAVETVALESGFGSTETMRRAFLAEIATSPQAYRQRFGRRTA